MLYLSIVCVCVCLFVCLFVCLYFRTLEALIDMPNSYVTDVYNDRVMITLKGVGWEGTYSFNINSLYVENAYYAAIDSWHTLTDSVS